VTGKFAVPEHREKKLDSPEEREALFAEIEATRRHLNAPWLIVTPDSKFMQYWDVGNMAFLCFTAIVTPYEVALLDFHWWDALFVMNRLVDLFFLCDLLLQFNLAYAAAEVGNRLVTDRRKIAVRYLNSWFVWDLLSVLPFDFIGSLSGEEHLANLKSLRIIRLLRLAKVAKFFKTSNVIRRWERRGSMSHAETQLIKFGTAIELVAHWLACLWCMQLASEAQGSYTWLHALTDSDGDGIISEDEAWSPISIYSAALYWAVVTITSVGYGDICGQNPFEFRVATICVLLSACLWAYIIGCACGIISNLDMASINHHQMLDQLNYFIIENRHEFSPQLRDQMREYFHHTAAMRRTEDHHVNIISKV
jgi:potassium voltage-gated channel Eag-related subfamily H protein 7